MAMRQKAKNVKESASGKAKSTKDRMKMKMMLVGTLEGISWLGFFVMGTFALMRNEDMIGIDIPFSSVAVDFVAGIENLTGMMVPSYTLAGIALLALVGGVLLSWKRMKKTELLG